MLVKFRLFARETNFVGAGAILKFKHLVYFV